MAEEAGELAKAEAMPGRYFTGGNGAGAAAAKHVEGPAGTTPVPSSMQGKVISVDVAEGATVAKGQQIAVLEAMKMEHTITAPHDGVVAEIATEGLQVNDGAMLVRFQEAE